MVSSAIEVRYLGRDHHCDHYRGTVWSVSVRGHTKSDIRLLMLTNFVWSVLLAVLTAVLAVVLTLQSRDPLRCSGRLVQNSRKLETVSLSVPTCGVLVLNQLTAVYAVTSHNVSQALAEVFGVQWFWTVSGIDVTLVTESILGDCVGVCTNFFLLMPVASILGLEFTALDVIHCFTLVTVGVKLDCIPSRLATTELTTSFVGVTHGQCSELCGVLHGFMPVTLLAV